MSLSKLSHTKIHPEIRKFPFDQTFLCPKCSEILFVNIFYIKRTIIPQVQYICPKKHCGNVDLPLFFDLFHSSFQDIEDELSKFDENLEKDIETYKNKKSKEKKILDPINFAELINKKNKKKEDEKNKEVDHAELIQNKINTMKAEEKFETPQLFKEIKKCNEIKFSLLNIKKEIKKPKPLEKQLSKSESKTNEKIEKNLLNNNQIKIKKINKSYKNSFSPKEKMNNINVIKKQKSKEKKEEESKEPIKDIKKEEEPKIPEKTKDQKEIKEVRENKFLCSNHGRNYTGYCFSCKKNMCKKCFKKRGHKKRKMFGNLLTEKHLNELNKILNQCQESLNKFKNKANNIIEELNNKEREQKVLLELMSNAYININKDILKEIKETIKIYNNCANKSMLNYETIMNVKNINVKNAIIIPNDVLELIKILKNYKNYIIQKNVKNNNNNEEENKEDKNIQLFTTFCNILKNYENKEINFKEIIEDENFRKLIDSNDYGKFEIDKKENKLTPEEENELDEIKKMEEYDMNYLEDGYDNYEEYLEEEEDENELEYDEDDYENYNDEDFEDEYNYVISENMRIEQNEKKETK